MLLLSNDWVRSSRVFHFVVSFSGTYFDREIPPIPMSEKVPAFPAGRLILNDKSW